MKTPKQLISHLFICALTLLLSSVNNLAAQSVNSKDLSVSLLGDGTYACAEDPLGVFLLRVFANGDFSEIRFRTLMRRLRRRIRTDQRRLRRANRRGATELSAILEERIATNTDLRNDVLACRNGALTSLTEDNSGEGSGVNSPPLDSTTSNACSIVGGTDSNSLRSNTEFPRASIITGTQCVAGNSPVVQIDVLDQLGEMLGSCTGTFISSSAVLTAAHCFLGDRNGSPAAAEIVTGLGRVGTAGYFVHPDFNPNSFAQEEHDLAVILVGQPVTSRWYSILSTSDLQPGEQALIAGYGLDELGGFGEFRAGFMNIGAIVTESIAAQYNGQGSNTCTGDSGGPLLVQRGAEWVIAGVTSNGQLENCGPGDTSFFVNLTSASNLSFVLSILAVS